MQKVSTHTKNEAETASFKGIVRDLVRDGISTSTNGFFIVPIPAGCNRAEILCAVSGGAAGNLLVFRTTERERSSSSTHLNALAATLAFNAMGSRTVLELPPDGGLIQAAQTGLPALATMQATIIFWRQAQ